MFRFQPIGPGSRTLLPSMFPRPIGPIIERFISFGILSHSFLWYKPSGGFRRAWCSLTLIAGFNCLKLPLAPVMVASWLRVNSELVMVWIELWRTYLSTHTPSPQSTSQVMTPVVCSCDLGHGQKQAMKNPAIAYGVVCVWLVRQEVLLNLFRTVFRYFAVRRMSALIAFEKYSEDTKHDYANQRQLSGKGKPFKHVHDFCMSRS